MIPLPLSKPELFAYTPHQGCMLLLDRLEEYSLDRRFLRSTVDVTGNSVFFDRETDLVPIWVAFEYMAQSIGLLAGLNSVECGGTPEIGFIMGVRNFEANAAGFAPGDRVDVSVRSVYRDGDAAVFEGRAEVNGNLSASGIVNTIQAGTALLVKMKKDSHGDR